MVIVVLTVILVMTLIQSPRAIQAAPQAAGAPMLAVTVITVATTTRMTVTTTYARLVDLGPFTVHSADSLLELTYNGRFYIEAFDEGSTGAYFELRVDDVTSTIGHARATLKWTEAGGGGVSVSFTGFFSGLAAGDHTASIWVRTSSLTASRAVSNPSGGPAVLIVKEHLPFGFSYLPMITK